MPFALYGHLLDIHEEYIFSYFLSKKTIGTKAIRIQHEGIRSGEPNLYRETPKKLIEPDRSYLLFDIFY